MSENIIIEHGEIKISEIQETPSPIKTGLAQALRQLTISLQTWAEYTSAGQSKIDRICSQLTTEQWATLAITQIQIIAVYNTDAQQYLQTLPK